MMTTTNQYSPAYKPTSEIVRLVGDIGEEVGRFRALSQSALTPRLRRENRLRTIQASLAIENNTLTLDQVTAVIDGKRVLGHPREIQEVRNAFAAYEKMETWNPSSRKDLLAAHRSLMEGLTDDPGKFRTGGVGIFQGKQLVHMAPGADQVPGLMKNLHGWLRTTSEHPLVASCLFHYELEFIHPFSDGNGRIGRLWQTLILRRWHALLGYLPVETVIRERQKDYYRTLAESDKTADAAPFVAFMLQALRDALAEAASSDQVADQVTDQVKSLLRVIGEKERGARELMESLDLSHRPTFRKNYLAPAQQAGLIESTQPDSPRSPTQRYRLTTKGRAMVQGS